MVCFWKPFSRCPLYPLRRDTAPIGAIREMSFVFFTETIFLLSDFKQPAINY
ncbi:hypothetical protein FSS13T_20790 [Flavobacterium saliperosum S13]|uniref:Uncharacterized protein n=1 Tax=Flavobacterium saliperosum S13 TaxID=1341155 RepID=A0ABP2ZXX3_9FLAO|nr:hypothetical protein FSS13T_20790 [Flavobacterium saliperosum S13]